MTAIEYRTVDKAAWGEGPWLAEPDKRQWKDPETGLPCLIVRGPLGALCGYVGVGPDHPAHGHGYSVHSYDIEDVISGEAAKRAPMQAKVNDLTAHGGLTFTDGCQHGDDPARGVCHIPEPGEPDAVWWFGFDCSHAGDVAPGSLFDRQRIGQSTGWGDVHAYRDLAYVEAQVASLAKQLAALGRTEQ